MVTLPPRRSPRCLALTASLATLFLAGCALIQPPPVPSVPRVGQGGLGGAACEPSISQAHVALAGAAGGDPAATAAAHAAHAAAMSEYHNCLARRTRP